MQVARDLRPLVGDRSILVFDAQAFERRLTLAPRSQRKTGQPGHPRISAGTATSSDLGVGSEVLDDRDRDEDADPMPPTMAARPVVSAPTE